MKRVTINGKLADPFSPPLGIELVCRGAGGVLDSIASQAVVVAVAVLVLSIC